MHPDHLRTDNERYAQTRQAFGQYVVVNLKKPLRDIGVTVRIVRYGSTCTTAQGVIDLPYARTVYALDRAPRNSMFSYTKNGL